MSKVLTTLYEYVCLSDSAGIGPLTPQTVLDDYFTDSVVTVVNGFGTQYIAAAKTQTQVLLPLGARALVYLSALSVGADAASTTWGMVMPYTTVAGSLANSAPLSGPTGPLTSNVYFPIRVGTLASVPAEYLGGRLDVGMASNAGAYPTPLATASYSATTQFSATVLYYI
jgi:hypothetical protein